MHILVITPAGKTVKVDVGDDAEPGQKPKDEINKQEFEKVSEPKIQQADQQELKLSTKQDPQFDCP